MSVPPILIQSGTINLIPNPSPSGGSTTGWTSVGGTITIEGSGDAATFRATSSAGGAFNVTTPAGTNGIEIDPSTDYVWSCEVTGVAGRNVFLRLRYYDASGAQLANHQSTTTAMTGSPQTLFVTAASGSSAVYAAVAAVATSSEAGHTLDVRLPQLEVGTSPTPFVAGTRPAQQAPGFLAPGTPVLPLTPH